MPGSSKKTLYIVCRFAQPIILHMQCSKISQNGWRQGGGENRRERTKTSAIRAQQQARKLFCDRKIAQRHGSEAHFSRACLFPGSAAGLSWMRSRKVPFIPLASETLDSPNLSRKRSAAASA